MFYREVEPDLYTIDGNNLDGIGFAGQPDTIGQQVVSTCDAYGFTVLRNTFSQLSFGKIMGDICSVVEEHDKAGYIRHVKAPGVQNIEKTDEQKTILPPDTLVLLHGLIGAIYAASAESRRMDTSSQAISTAFVMRAGPKANVKKHYDETSGIVLETSLAGSAEMKVWLKRGWLARVVLEPNDTVIMPGQTAGSRGHPDQVAHSLRNSTSPESFAGHRLALTYIYGRLHPEERATWLQSRTKLWHNRRK